MPTPGQAPGPTLQSPQPPSRPHTTESRWSALESAPVNGVKRAITYTFARDSYVVGVKQEVVNGSAASVNPQWYVQLQRDGQRMHPVWNALSFVNVEQPLLF